MYGRVFSSISIIAEKILDTSIGPRNLNNIFWLIFLDEVLDCYTALWIIYVRKLQTLTWLLKILKS